MPAPTTSLIARLALWPTTADAHETPAAWANDPVLCGYNGAAAAAAAAADPTVLAALASRAADRVATLAAMAAIGPGLGRVFGSWCRLGLAGDERDEVEADLVCEALGALRDRPEGGVEAVAGRAVHRVQNRRRTEWARAERRVSFDDTADQPTAADVSGGALGWIVDVYAAGLITLMVAQVLWLVADGADTSTAAGLAGCTPTAWRQRRRRAGQQAAALVRGAE